MTTSSTSSTSLSTTIGQIAAKNPTVGFAVAQASVQAAILYGMQSGDSATSGLYGALAEQNNIATQLFSSVSPTLGQNVNLLA